MATLNDLPNVCIASMDEGDLIVHIMAVRSSRRIQKRSIKKPASKKAKTTKSTDVILSAMTPDQAVQLLKRLGG